MNLNLHTIKWACFFLILNDRIYRMAVRTSTGQNHVTIYLHTIIRLILIIFFRHIDSSFNLIDPKKKEADHNRPASRLKGEESSGGGLPKKRYMYKMLKHFIPSLGGKYYLPRFCFFFKTTTIANAQDIAEPKEI